MAHIFKIGDRVALVHPSGNGSVGQQGTINCFGDWPKGTIAGDGGIISHDCNVAVIWDKYADGRDSAQHTDQLEPIQRRGDKLTAYDTTATDEATKAMLKAMSGQGVAA